MWGRPPSRAQLGRNHDQRKIKTRRMEVRKAKPIKAKPEIRSPMKSALLPLRVISFSRLHCHVLLLRGQRDLVIPRRIRVRLHGRVAQFVLLPQFLGNARIYLIDRLLLRHLKHPPTRFLRDALENLLPIYVHFLRPSASASAVSAAPAWPSPTAAPGPPSSATAHPAAAPVASIFMAVIFEHNRIHQRVRPLGCLDRVL